MNKPTRPTVGPRGGRAVQATPCAECVSWRSCRPAPITEPFGCESWVDQSGQRALPDQLEAEDGAAEYERDRIEAEADLKRLRDLPTEPKDDQGETIQPCRENPGESCSDCRNCETTAPDPAGAGFTFESLGGLVKGRCGAPEPILSNPEPDPEPFRPAAPYAPDPKRGEAPAQSCLEMPDAGPLFAGCPEVRR